MPVSTSIASEKLRTILLVVATAVALSAGEEELKVGDVESDELFKLNWTWLFEESWKLFHPLLFKPEYSE